jgi:hypothetical protein
MSNANEIFQGQSGKRSGQRARRVRSGALGIAAALIAIVLPAVAAADPCMVTDVKEAASLAERLYSQGQFQRAGECYTTAGDLPRANEAFIRAVQPSGQSSAQGLHAQADTAKALFTQVAGAFRTQH